MSVIYLFIQEYSIKWMSLLNYMNYLQFRNNLKRWYSVGILFVGIKLPKNVYNTNIKALTETHPRQKKIKTNYRC